MALTLQRMFMIKKGKKSSLKKYKWAAQMDNKWAVGWDETMLGLRG